MDLTRQLPIGTAVLDPEGVVVFWDDGAERLLGFGRADAIGRNFFSTLGKSQLVESLLPVYRNGVKAGDLDIEFRGPGKKEGATIRFRIRDLAVDSKPGGLVIMEELSRKSRQRGWTSETELYRAATRDALTGLANRAFFVDLLDIELQRCKRTKAAATFVMVVLEEGRVAAGSEDYNRLVSAIARVLRRMSRTTDIIARLGSDRFGVVLTSTDLDGARRFIDRVRRSFISASRAVGGEVDKLAAYFGLVVPADVGYKSTLVLQSADRAAAEARRVGPGHAVVATVKSLQALGDPSK